MIDLTKLLPFALVAGVFVAASRITRNNPDGAMFRDQHGILHPIRGWSGYHESTVEDHAYKRKQLGYTSADQQLQVEFDREMTKTQKVERLQEKLSTLQAEREGYRMQHETDNAADLIKLIRRVNREGAHGGEIDLIPLGQAKRLTGIRSFHSTVVKNGHHYVPREYVLDELAEEAGYRDSADLERGILRANRDRVKANEIDRHIRNLTEDIRIAKAERKAKLKPKVKKKAA